MPVIIQRFARERLLAVAQADGTVEEPLPEVLFVRERNAGEVSARRARAPSLQRPGVGVRSARSHPDEQIDPVVVQAMLELAIDVTRERVPKASHGRGRARGRRCRHAGVRGRVRGVPGQALPGLAGPRICWASSKVVRRVRYAALSPRLGAARDARSRQESDRHPPTDRGER